MNIVYKDILGYEDIYVISNTGIVKKLEYTYIRKTDKALITRKAKVMKTRVLRGYETIGLTKEGCQKTHQVHRLIAEAFIPNPRDCVEVNHIDGVKTNNNLSNLEWVTTSENALHAFSLGLRKTTDGGTSKKVVKLCPDTNEVLDTYPSLRYIEKTTKFLRKEVSLACRNGRIYKGFLWKFL